MSKHAAKQRLFTSLLTIGILFGFTFLFSHIYEEKNTLVGLSICLMLLMFPTKDLGIRLYQALILLGCFFLGSAILSQIASLHPVVGFFVNVICILFIMLTFTEQPQEMLYIPFLLMYVFEAGNPCDIFDFLLRLMGLLVGFILVGSLYYLMHPKKKERNRTLQTIFMHIEPQTNRFNLACKTALTLSSVILVCDLCPQKNAGYAIFIALTILQLLSTDIYTANIKNPILPFVGLTLGAIGFYVFIPQQFFILAFLLFCILFALIKPYRIQMILITISAMGAAQILLDIDTYLPWRMVPLIASLIIPVLITRINFSKIVFRIQDKFFPPNYNVSK